MLTQLEYADKVAGVKQTRRALQDGRAKLLFLARDADPGLTEPLVLLAQERGVPVQWIDAMRDLGRACGIAVGAAVAAVI
ncbi:MAG TPA: ribosomal L7Ae/L30e/S12e/Gadd45 family protein [Candidatus Enterenecus stercoripullorum]|nr:ribosomal L7Ae/L30e/S12e/Gadd45 family protein [Candidatus Enterenecus stercoripullorum]